MSTDLVPHEPKQRAPKGSPIGRSDRGKVTGKLKDALDLVVNEGLEPYEASAKVGLHARSMRLALNKRHVITYLRQQREVFRLTASAQNIHYAVKMRADARNDMARLGAMKFIEADDEEVQQRRGFVSAPGLVIQVIQAPSHTAHVRSIDANPLIDQGCDRLSRSVEAPQPADAAPHADDPPGENGR